MQISEILLVCCVCLTTTNYAKVVYESPAVLSVASDFNEVRNGFGGLLRKACPLCDSSVYGYCSEKLFHDSCCCHNPNNPYDTLPRECHYADCNFLYANSCREHKLITACCCTSHRDNYYYF